MTQWESLCKTHSQYPHLTVFDSSKLEDFPQKLWAADLVKEGKLVVAEADVAGGEDLLGIMFNS